MSMTRILAAAIAMMLAATACALAQSYPTKPVQVIVPIPPGGSNDKRAREVEKALAETKLIPTSMTVVSKPGGGGSMLDHTLIVWTNELGKGNSHTLDNIPFVLLGGGFGFGMGRALKFDKVPHNRLHLALAHAVGHRVATFGKPDFCTAGPLGLG